MPAFRQRPQAPGGPREKPLVRDSTHHPKVALPIVRVVMEPAIAFAAKRSHIELTVPGLDRDTGR
jgi:hypothetical protein